jgi:phospholipid:diacylglycerol acyltransferase
VKLRIEQNRKIEGKKTVLVAHSMGSSVALYFMKWCVLLRRHAVSGC